MCWCYVLDVFLVPAGVVGVGIISYVLDAFFGLFGVIFAVLLLNQDNLILLFCCNVYFILVNFCNGGPAGVVGVMFWIQFYVLDPILCFGCIFSFMFFDPGVVGVCGLSWLNWSY